ncbi:MAG: hypothetical protein ACK5ME_03655 [Parahaliea sp.]
MRKYNLTYTGDIQPGYTSSKVKKRFAELLAIEDTSYLNHCFSGELVIVSGDLPRKEAADLYRRLDRLGMVVELVPITIENNTGGTNTTTVAKETGTGVSSQPVHSDGDSQSDSATNKPPADNRKSRRAARRKKKRKNKDTKVGQQDLLAEANTASDQKKPPQPSKPGTHATVESANHSGKSSTSEPAAENKISSTDQVTVKAEASEVKATAKDKIGAAPKTTTEPAQKSASKSTFATKLAEHTAKHIGQTSQAQSGNRTVIDATSAPSPATVQAEFSPRQESLPQSHTSIQTDTTPLSSTTRGETFFAPGIAQTLDHRPNIYALWPFRSLPQLRERPVQARRLRLYYLLASTVCILALITISLVYLLLPAPVIPKGPDLVAPLHSGGLLLAVDDELLIHDRAGIGREYIPLRALGLASVSQWLPAREKDDYFVVGKALPRQDGDTGTDGLWRCNLQSLNCETYGPQTPAPIRIGLHSYSNVMVQALAIGDTDKNNNTGAKADYLRKLNIEGEPLADAPHTLAPEPTLYLQDGLLYTNSTQGPALSVLRYENEALGQQLDEILMLAPLALKAGRERVDDFIFVGNKWWVILYNPKNQERGLYLFDEKWAYFGSLPLTEDFKPEYLLSWGEKILVIDPEHTELRRFNSEAQEEVPLRSDLLTAKIEERKNTRWWRDFLWRFASIILLLGAFILAAMAYIQHLRQLAFKPGHLRGADPIESFADNIQWLQQSSGRELHFQRWLKAYCILAGLIFITAIILRTEPHLVTALLLLLTGPGIAGALYLRSPTGHIGMHNGRLLLVDHKHIYHIGNNARILYHGWFLMIDDVLVYTGPGWAPAFISDELREHIVPMAHCGVRVDRRSVLIRLIEGRHPLIICSGIALLCSIGALIIAVAGA